VSHAHADGTASAYGVTRACPVAGGSRAARRMRAIAAIIAGMTLLVQCEFRVQRPELESELIRVARALASAVIDEPGTLRYQWFVAHKPGHYTILEEYVDADAAEAHNEHVHALLVEFFAVAELVSIAFYGALNKYLRDWITGREGVALNVPL
jgi:quinol monooxygenase YgiN